MIPVPPSAPPNLKTFFQSVVAALEELTTPTMPHPVYRTASTTLPNPALFTGCILDLTDLNTLAKSDGTNWRRVDTGATL